jgi:hypothetical protein
MPQHITLAVSEAAFNKVWEKARDSFHVTRSGSGSFGPVTAAYNAGVRLHGGTLDFRSDGSIHVDELDVVYDPLDLTLGIDLPPVCVGGFCLIHNPFGGGCLLSAPQICIFQGSPDVAIPLDVGSLIESEISGAFTLATRYEVNPARTSWMTDLDAEDAGVPNMWNLYLDPVWLDLDLVDVSDTLGNILDMAIANAVGGLLGWLPGWAQNLVSGILGSLSDLVRNLLDLGDDLDEWLSNLLGVSLGLFDFVLNAVLDYFARRIPVFGIEDPFPILKYTPWQIPVKFPIRNLGLTVNSAELVLNADVGV